MEWGGDLCRPGSQGQRCDVQRDSPVFMRGSLLLPSCTSFGQCEGICALGQDDRLLLTVMVVQQSACHLGLHRPSQARCTATLLRRRVFAIKCELVVVFFVWRLKARVWPFWHPVCGTPACGPGPQGLSVCLRATPACLESDRPTGGYRWMPHSRWRRRLIRSGGECMAEGSGRGGRGTAGDVHILLAPPHATATSAAAARAVHAVPRASARCA